VLKTVLLSACVVLCGTVSPQFAWAQEVAVSPIASEVPVGNPLPLRGPIPEWVQPLAPAALPAMDSLPIRILSLDSQIRIEGQRQHQFSRTRMRLQTQDGLRAGGVILLPWNPASQSLTVHHILIYRGDQVIDALGGHEFEIIRREENLTAATLDGVLTAVLQPADLRVGDILEVAGTLTYQDPALQGHASAILSSNVPVTMDRLRYRVTWPQDRPVRVLTTEPWTQPTIRTRNGQREIELTDTDLRALTPPSDAPPRFGFQRELLVSDFRDWAEVSALMDPLYVTASQLAPDSALRAEIERIATEHTDVRGRTLAALKLVQDNVRYVALTMGDGNYVPASADETWRRRFGDCKAMTALLLALLRELDVPAEASLVSSARGDGLNDRLPMLAAFDHVLVRVNVDGTTYLIDGTRQGDRTLEDAPVDAYKWTLPIRPTGSDLERVIQPQVLTPGFGASIVIDSSAGIDAPAQATVTLSIGGEAARAFDAGLSSLPEDERKEALDGVMDGFETYFDLGEVTTSQDPQSGVLHIRARGTSKLIWSGTAGTRRRLQLPSLAILYDAPEERDEEEDKDIPYAIAFPQFHQNRVTVILPNGGQGFAFDTGLDVNEEVAGHRYLRQVGIENGDAVAVASSMALVGEITAAQAEADRDRIEGLDEKSVVLLAPADYQTTAADRASLEAELTDVSALLRRADLLIAQGDFDRAETTLDRAVELDGEETEALYARGDLHLTRGNFEAARQDFELVKERDDSDMRATSSLGLTWLYLGQPEEALIEYTALSRSRTNRRLGLRMRGQVYRSLGRLDRALTDFSAAARDDDKTAQSLAWIVRAERGETDAVRQEVQERLEADKADVQALTMLMVLMVEADTPALAMSALDAAVASDPDDEDLRELRAGLKGRLGDTDGALADLAGQMQRAAGDPDVQNSLCWLMAENGFALEQALALCNAALASSPNAANILDSRALVLLHLGRTEEALADYERVLRLNAMIVPTRYGRGLARLALGDAGGQEDIDLALVVNPDVGRSFEVYEQRHVGR
jgi:hypothetical protein